MLSPSDEELMVRVQEGDGAFGSLARGGVDQLDAVDLEVEEGLGEVRNLEADMVEALAALRDEAGHAGRVVGRLHELDLRLPDAEEGDPDVVALDVHDRLEIEPERVTPQSE